MLTKLEHMDKKTPWEYNSHKAAH